MMQVYRVFQPNVAKPDNFGAHDARNGSGSASPERDVLESATVAQCDSFLTSDPGSTDDSPPMP